MSENLQNFIKGASMLRNVVNRVPADAWDSTSCCEGWSAKQVAGHITWGLETVANFAGGGEMAAEMPEAERAGDDPAATVTRAVDGAIAALDRPGALQHDTPFGMPLDNFLQIMGVDSLTHAWDIADAVGIEPGIDEATATAALETMKPMEVMMRAPGRFDAAVETQSANAIDQFIAFTGRRSVNA
ncbi:MAG: TIGR03086 family metal-binding protein [Actinomycetota bacterium]